MVEHVDDQSQVSVSTDKDFERTVESGDERLQPPVAQKVDSPSTIGPRSSPWYFRLAPKLVRPVAWAATVIIGSLLVPAVTKQWSDRPQELGIKMSLVRDISELATATIEGRMDELRGLTPEDRLVRAAAEELQRAQGSEKQEAQRRYYDARRERDMAVQRIATEESSALRVKGAVIRAQLQAYFPETKLANDWGVYIKAAEHHQNLSSGACGSGRTSTIAQLRTYLAESGSRESINWEPLASAPYGQRCPTSDRNAFMSSYISLAKELSLNHERLLGDIMKADMAVFSSGWRDLIRDVL